jgi:hypothetical protein
MVFFCIPCLALLVYFLIMSIFFPRYRVYIREGWRCFIDKLKGRKCSVSFDNRMRLAFSGWLTKRGMVRMGRFFNDERNFNMTLTAIAVITTIISIYLIVLFVYFQLYPPCTQDSAC